MTDGRSVVFDYRALRLLMGLIALALPFVVTALAHTALSSISASYHTDARDAFVGMLCVVGAFLWAYNGHTPPEGRASKIASLAAILVALFPTACDTCQSGIVSVIHYLAAVTLFSILAYFCFRFFRKNTKGQPRMSKKWRRDIVYFACGAVMVACMLIAALANLALSRETLNAWQVTYWAEAIALGAFGIAWIVAGKYLPLFADQDEELRLFS